MIIWVVSSGVSKLVPSLKVVSVQCLAVNFVILIFNQPGIHAVGCHVVGCHVGSGARAA